MIGFDDLPALNATLNGIATVLLTVAFVAIKRGSYRVHGWVMVLALFVSAAFLTSYLIYHSRGIVTPFPSSGWRPVYLAILISHIILAAVILPLILMTTWRA